LPLPCKRKNGRKLVKRLNKGKWENFLVVFDTRFSRWFSFVHIVVLHAYLLLSREVSEKQKDDGSNHHNQQPDTPNAPLPTAKYDQIDNLQELTISILNLPRQSWDGGNWIRRRPTVEQLNPRQEIVDISRDINDIHRGREQVNSAAFQK